MTFVIGAAQYVRRWQHHHHRIWLSATMMATIGVLMMTHFLEVLAWAATYLLVDALPPGSDAVYFAMVNYTTLGYGDILPMERWRLLGPAAAMNGILLFGWSTAVVFEILRKAIDEQ